ncbi:MAG: chloride channel protein [Actinomycetota bacterium]
MVERSPRRLRDTLLSLLPEGRPSRLLAAAIGVGVMVGVAVAVLDYLVVILLLENVLELPLYIQAGAPLVGLLLTTLLLTTLGQNCGPSTSEEYVKAFHARHPSFPMGPLRARLLAGAATIGLGGAVGLEGPAVYMGSAIGLQVQSRLERLLGKDAGKLLLTAGAAAGVSALFQAPATGLIFALESPYRDDVAHRALLPSLMASAASFLTFASMPFIERGTDWGFAFNPGIGAGELAGAVALGVGAGFGGRGFAWATRRAKDLSAGRSPWTTAVAGGVVLGVLAVIADRLFEEPLTLGPGFEVVEWLDEDHSLMLIVVLFFFRAIATLSTVGAGGVGGLFIPLAVQGVILGTIVGDLLDRIGWGTDGALWPILGLAAFLAAGYRTPIAAVMFVAESSSSGSVVVPALVAAAVSQLVAGTASVSAAQRVERRGHLEERFALPLVSALTTDVLTVPSDATISEFVWGHALGRRQRVVPVVDGAEYRGLCAVDDVSAVERDRWEAEAIETIMVADIPTARPSWNLRDAVAAMDAAGTDMLAVTDEQGNFVGVVYESEIVKLGEILDETEGK